MLFINNSKATNLDAMARAIESFSHGIHLIAGGRDKASPSPGPRARSKGAFARSTSSAKPLATSDRAWSGAVECVHAGTLEHALELSTARAEEGDVIMLPRLRQL